MKVLNLIPVERLHSSLSMSLMPFCFYLCISLSCQTLLKTLDMSRNTPLNSKPLSKEVKIWKINRSLFTEESSDLNPNCFREIKLLFKKYFKMLSKNLLQIGRRETGQLFLMFLPSFLNIGTMFPVFHSSESIPHFKEFLNIVKSGSIRYNWWFNWFKGTDW